MRPLVIIVLSATLAGCTWFAPQQARRASLTVDRPQTDLKLLHSATRKKNARHHRKAGTHIKVANLNLKMGASSCVQPDNKSNVSANTNSAIAAKSEAPQSPAPAKSAIAAQSGTPASSQSGDRFDPVIKKAIPAIAEKMADSASVELVEMKRVEKNVLGKSIDTICGYVRGKSASGAETVDRPFLYLVQGNEAYVGGYNMATSPYHNLCQ
jgi:hypothetical protein